MNNYIIAVLITLLAGFSTLVGALIVTVNKQISKKKMIYILGFTVGIMLFLTIFELIPETYEFFRESVKLYLILPALFLSVIVGISLTYLFDNLLHHDEKQEDHNLYHIGILTMLAVSLHKLPEAITLFIVAFANFKLGLLMAIAIAIHHIPEGIMIASPIYHETKSRWKAFKFTLFSCLINPLGIILVLFFSKYFNNPLILGSLFGISVGMFIFLIFRELIPTIIKYKENKKAFLAFILGISFIYICHLLLG